MNAGWKTTSSATLFASPLSSCACGQCRTHYEPTKSVEPDVLQPSLRAGYRDAQLDKDQLRYQRAAAHGIWTLDASFPYEKMRWDPVEVKGVKPRQRGYHTANLVGDSVVIIGGSDGAECFEDVLVLNLGPSAAVFDFWHCD
jgi:hypothetical protein